MSSFRTDMSEQAITARLRLASVLSDLDPARRLEGKIDMSPKAITERLREAAALLELCTALARGRGAL
ncbi:MAG: hypothetical protein ACHQ53_15440 [Polyangiales bacterium]